jgi:ketosteroid isomerase-like protein
MASDTNRDRLNRFFAAFRAGDEATQATLLHPEFSITEADSLPYGGTYRGLSGWRSLINRIHAAWTDVVISPQFVIGSDDDERFAALHRFQGRAVTSGATFDTSIFELWRLCDGLIVDIRPYYWDTKLLADVHAAP